MRLVSVDIRTVDYFKVQYREGRFAIVVGRKYLDSLIFNRDTKHDAGDS